MRVRLNGVYSLNKRLAVRSIKVYYWLGAGLAAPGSGEFFAAFNAAIAGLGAHRLRSEIEAWTNGLPNGLKAVGIKGEKTEHQ